jgi:hypothetical protein
MLISYSASVSSQNNITTNTTTTTTTTTNNNNNNNNIEFNSRSRVRDWWAEDKIEF